MYIAYLSDFPFSFAFGGKEVQLLSYYQEINTYYSDTATVRKLDLWDRDGLNEVDALHLFGYSNWYVDLLITLKSKHPEIKIIISPTFYFEKIGLMKLKGYISKFYSGIASYTYRKTIFELADRLVVNSEAEKMQIISVFGNSLEEKIHVVYNAIEPSFFDIPAEPHCFLKRYSLEPGYLLSISFSDERKNSIGLIKSFLKAYPTVKRKLVLIGSQRFQSRDLANEFSSLVSNNNDKIIHIDYIDRNTEIDFLKSAILNCKAHVLVSFIETPGLANIEALAMKKPILVGACPPVLEYFQGKAVYCDPNSLTSIEDGITKVVSMEDSTEYSSFVKDRYTLPVSVSKLLSIYHS